MIIQTKSDYNRNKETDPGMRTLTRRKEKNRTLLLAAADILLAALLVCGWFAARIGADLLRDDESFSVSDARAELMSESSPTPLPSSGQTTPAAVPTEAPQQTPEPTPEPDTRTEWQIRFEEHFTDEVIVTDSSYTSQNLSVNITHHEVGEDKEKITYHLADVYIGNIECFRSGLAATPPRFRMSASLLGMMEDNDAVVAVNGDFCGYSYGGITVRNGVVWSTRSSGVDICVLYRDGRMSTFSSGKFRLDEAIVDDVFQVWSFGPALLNEDGTPRDIPWSAIPNVHISGRNPRTAIGYFEPGHYCFLVVDGRQIGYSRGMTLDEMAELFHSLGCMAAFNLDGGGSSMMAFNGELISQIYSKQPRNLSDCLYFTDWAPIETEDMDASSEDPVEAAEAGLSPMSEEDAE